jgi:hypothetical protein
MKLTTIAALLLLAPAAVSPAEAGEPRSGKRFTVQVDHRVELFSILFRLAGVREYGRAPDTPYTRAVDAHFEAFREHPAVLASRDLHTTKSIGYNAPMDLAVHLDSASSLEPAVPLDPHPRRLDSRWRKVAIGPYLAKVQAFARASKFGAFMASQRAYHRKVEARLAAVLEGEDPTRWLDGFFGPKPGVRVVLVPGLLNGPNGYGCSVVFPGGGEIISPILGLGRWLAKDTPAYEDRQGLVSYLFHEVAHAYVNPIVDAHAGILEPVAAPVYRTVREQMKRQAYGSWRIMMYESGVRAATALFLRDRFGPQAAQREIGRDEARSFLWMQPLVDLLDRYRGERDRYGDFAAFMPEVAAFFARWSKLPPAGRRPPFRGTINAALLSHGPTLLVAPVVVKGSPASKAARDFVRQIHESIFARRGVELRAADEVGEEDLSTRSLILYGTPRSNPVLARMLEGFGWRVAEDGIHLDGRQFEGRGLALIACKPHPRDDKQAVTVYTAGRDEDLVNLNSLFHGPTDWIVARHVGGGRFEEVASGDFPRDGNGRWLPLAKEP